jgi:Fic family protein
MLVHPKSRLGTFITASHTGETVRAFLPPPLPPEPALDLVPLTLKLERANQALGRLDAVSLILPSPDVFLFMFVRKEALLSSQIEGTQSSLSELLLFETEESTAADFNDVVEVSNYIRALNHGLDRLRGDFPLSLRLIREMHEILLARGRGSAKQPGEFRSTQNWIGGTRPGNALFVPPPPDRLIECLSNFETFLHRKNEYSPLIRAALAHVQFETIHPFLDGNGRLGRLLIALMLFEEGVLREPVLYLSLHLKTHRSSYYDLLQKVRLEGAWEQWLEFFLDGIIETSNQGIATAQRLLKLFSEDHLQISAIGRASSSALRVHSDLQRNPIISVPEAALRLGLSQPTLQTALNHLKRLEIVEEITGRQRNRLYRYSQYLAIVAEGTEPLPR